MSLFKGFPKSSSCEICKSLKCSNKDKIILCSAGCGEGVHISCANKSGRLSSEGDDSIYLCGNCDSSLSDSAKMSVSDLSTILLGQERLLTVINGLVTKIETLSNDNCILKALVDDQRKELQDIKHSLHLQTAAKSGNDHLQMSYSQIVQRQGKHRSSNYKARDLSDEGIATNAVLLGPDKQLTQRRAVKDLHSADVVATQDIGRLHLNKPSTVSYTEKNPVRSDQSKLGARNSTFLKVARKSVKPRTKAIFATRFDPTVTDKEISDYIQKEINIGYLKVAQLKTKFDTYASFHIAVAEKDYNDIFNPMFWPEGVLINHYRGPLKSEQLYVPPATSCSPSKLNTSTTKNSVISEHNSSMASEDQSIIR